MPERKQSQTPDEARAEELISQSTELADNPRDTTDEGGVYIVNDQRVDANGEPLKGKQPND